MRVVLADDSGLLRESFARMLSSRGFQVVAAVGDAERLLEAVARHEPDVALIDVRMPPTHTDEGLQAALRLRAARPGLGVLLLSAHADSATAIELMRGGSRGLGYLLKDRVADVGALVDALRRVGGGETAVDPEVVRLLLDGPRGDPGVQSLTQREHDILGLIAQGRSNQAIGAELFLSPKTVEAHISRILMKLDLPPDTDGHRRVLAVLRYLKGG